MRAIALLLFAVLLLAVPVRAAHPDTEFEKLIGKPVAWSVANAAGEETDPLLLRWVQSIGAKVSAQTPRQDIAYRFGILGTDAANAEALPGGYIFVTRGLLDYVESDDELAGVLAHESGHVAKKHALQQIGANLVFLGLINSVHGRKYDNARIAAGVYNIFRTLAKSREMETQADEAAILYTVKAGYDPAGLLSFLERIGGGRGKESRLEQYLATHPTPERRIAATQANALVRHDDPTEREQVAAGYAARGLPCAAAKLRRGEDPLRSPTQMPLVNSPDYIVTQRAALLERQDTIRKKLEGVFKTQRAGSGLQTLLLVNSQPADYRWLYLAFRAYAIQGEVEDLYARTVRTLRTAPATYDGLAAYATHPAGEPETVNGSIGRGEVEQSLMLLTDAPAPLARASQASVAILADLNNPFYHPKGAAAWARYGVLEGLALYADSELVKARQSSGPRACA